MLNLDIIFSFLPQKWQVTFIRTPPLTQSNFSKKNKAFFNIFAQTYVVKLMWLTGDDNYN